MEKIIRTICYFTQDPNQAIAERLEVLARMLEHHGCSIQTKRICATNLSMTELEHRMNDQAILKSVGTLKYEDAQAQLGDFLALGNIAFNTELAEERIQGKHVAMLFDIIAGNARATFNFAYVFNNTLSSPYFPSATFGREGFAIGLQSTNLAAEASSHDAWFRNMQETWREIETLLSVESDYLGIDSSIAPLYQRGSSLIHFIKKSSLDFSRSVLSDTYLRMTEFIKRENPHPVGLCGLMLPCLEDFELADEYANGNFSIERNLFLSLHSGLGIDTYPIGRDEDPEKVLAILKLVQGLSNKYHKPLSVRFVSDGEARIGEMTDFQNQYLKDVIVREL